MNSQLTGIGSLFPKDSYGSLSKIVDLPGLRFFQPYALFEFDNLSDDNRATLVDAGLEVEPSKGECYGGCPSFQSMRAVWNLEPTNARSHPGYLSVEGCLAYLFFLKGMAAYATVSHGIAALKGPISISAGSRAVTDAGTIDVEMLRTTGKVSMTLAAAGFMSLDETTVTPITVPVDETKTFHRGYTTTSAKRFINNLTGQGRFFPYFKGCTLPDKTTAFRTFADIFFNTLFDDNSKAPGLLNILRRGAANLANKEAGMAIAHAYQGIRLSKQSHAAITFVITGQNYQGFVLEGDFTIAMYSTVYKPEPMVDVLTRIDAIGSHDQALVAIVAMFGLAKRADGSPKYSITVEDISTSRKFQNEYNKLQVGDFATLKDWDSNLRKKVEELYYENEEFQEINPTTVEAFLRYVNSGDEAWIAAKPTWIHSAYFEKATSKVARGLAVFGKYAPSINTGKQGDLTFNIPNLTALDPNLALKEDKRRHLQYLPVRKTGIENALGHWNRLFEQGKLHIPRAQKGSKRFTHKQGTVLEIGDEALFSTCYRLVKEKVNSQRAVRGNKRAIAEVEGSADAGPSSKKGKGRARVDF